MHGDTYSPRRAPTQICAHLDKQGSDIPTSAHRDEYKHRFAQIPTHTLIHAHIDTDMHMITHTQIPTHRPATHKHPQTHVQTCTSIDPLTCWHTLADMYIHLHTRNTHAHTGTHQHTRSQALGAGGSTCDPGPHLPPPSSQTPQAVGGDLPSRPSPGGKNMWPPALPNQFSFVRPPRRGPPCLGTTHPQSRRPCLVKLASAPEMSLEGPLVQ